ncbi:MAG TPA: hypothetical protein VL418_08050 [Devosiaceae bacterium]|nr:hypothetical protein [Devosiaceae bacterium]
MTMRTHLSVLAALVVLGASAPAAFAQAVPADANKALWCASAFGLVSPQARAQGQTAAADNFDKYTKALNDVAAASLKKAGFADDKIKAQSATYTDKVGKELAGGSAPEFSVVECTQLVDPAAAAAMQQAPAPSAPAGGAMAPATPAPATPAPAAK